MSHETPQLCLAPAPDLSGRTCDKPIGHDGLHWSYSRGGVTLVWAITHMASPPAVPVWLEDLEKAFRAGWEACERAQTVDGPCSDADDEWPKYLAALRTRG